MKLKRRSKEETGLYINVNSGLPEVVTANSKNVRARPTRTSGTNHE